MKKKEASGLEKPKKATSPTKKFVSPKKTIPTKKIVFKAAAKERQIPDKIVPAKLADYLEVVTVAAFQAGVSWSMIQNKWEHFRVAFASFDPIVVSKFTQKDIDRLMQDPGIMRSEKKILGTIENARVMLEMTAKHSGFQNYLRSFDSYEKLSVDIQKRFKFIGEMSVYYFLFRVNEKVPPFDPWITTIEGDHPRMREMVEKFTAAGSDSLL